MSRLIRNSRGATLIEAAIITPLLLLLTFAIVDFAGLFYCYLALENGASQATRYAITGNVVSGSSREDSIKSAMRAATPTLTIQDSMFSFSHLRPGATVWTSMIRGRIAAASFGVMRRMESTIGTNGPTPAPPRVIITKWYTVFGFH